MNDIYSLDDANFGSIDDDDEPIHDVPVVVPDDDDDDGREPGAGRAPIDLDSAYDISDLNAIFDKPSKAVKNAAKTSPGPDLRLVDAEEIPAAAPSVAPGVSAEREAELLALVEAEKGNTLRAIADLHNFRRRAEEERRRIVASANERLIMQLLPVVDDFDRSLLAAKQSQSYEQLVDGVEAVVRKIADTFAKEGVQPIPTVGEKFDPDYHDAVMVDEGSDQPDETITEEFRKGYTMHQRVIRPALVKVAKS